ncbi:cell division protein [Pseudalgibacter alginicilyticus]|uniref:Cell division protein n=1 Tax=Pseudalgibacter alginicilyticus TaxID=1736674 RepID=A0A0P0D1X5_9FLAO|nr:SRPBCC family protein [Pseudalgibacter alginicilyticus]ALJ03762.1 cell division protein [Pseudalgibacter alginicilyticus]
MTLIEVQTLINADIKSCFDLARSIDFHKESLKHTDEIPIAGKTTGLIEKGEWVSWEATHFGFVQHLTSKITAFDAPNYFVDEMVLGVFKSFKHEHIFKEVLGKTIMTDRLYFEPPLGILGKIANLLFLKRYMKKLLKTKNRLLKEKAESIN